MISGIAVEEFMNNVADGTDFQFNLENETELSVNGDNPCGEDWNMYITVPECETMKEVLDYMVHEFEELYENFDVEEETYIMLEAKRNGFRGVPGVVDLVHNEEYKKNALKEFANKLGALYETYTK